MFKNLKRNFREFMLSRKPISELAVKPTFKEKVVTQVTKAVDAVPGGGITLAAVVLTTLAFVMGHLMASAAIAGIVLSVSIACIYAGSPQFLKKALLYCCAKFGWYLDLALTVLLTVLGFQLGVTLGIVAMTLGLYISMMMAIARWYYDKKPFAFKETLPQFNVTPQRMAVA